MRGHYSHPLGDRSSYTQIAEILAIAGKLASLVTYGMHLQVTDNIYLSGWKFNLSQTTGQLLMSHPGYSIKAHCMSQAVSSKYPETTKLQLLFCDIT